jgi:hypothetical protein
MFLNLPIQCSSNDGLNVIITAPLYFLAASGDNYMVPVGATSDGASTPHEIWPLLPPFGVYWPAAVLHDAAYRNTLMVKRANAGFSDWALAALPRDRCDDLLKEAMRDLGVSEADIVEIYEGVHLCGEDSFVGDRK